MFAFNILLALKILCVYTLLLLTELKTTVKYFISIFELTVVVVNVVIYWVKEREKECLTFGRIISTNKTCTCEMKEERRRNLRSFSVINLPFNLIFD